MGFSLHDGSRAVDSLFESYACNVEGLSVALDGFSVEIALGVKDADFKIRYGKLGLHAQSDGFELCFAGIGIGCRSRDAAADFSPEVCIPRSGGLQVIVIADVTRVFSGSTVRGLCGEAGIYLRQKGTGCLAKEGFRLSIAGFGHDYIQISGVEFVHEFAEDGILEDFPPIPALDMVAGSGGVPLSDVFIMYRHGYFRDTIGRSHAAGRVEKQDSAENGNKEAGVHGCICGWADAGE